MAPDAIASMSLDAIAPVVLVAIAPVVLDAMAVGARYNATGLCTDKATFGQ